MLLENKEYEGIVVENVDPLGKSRLKVFIFGYHDLTGTLSRIESLPWAFSSQFIAFQSIPKIGSIVKVKFNFSYQQNLTWSPTSHYTKIGDKLTTAFPFLVKNPEKDKFINAINNSTIERQKAFNKDVESLESEKASLESEVQQLKEKLERLSSDQKIETIIELESTTAEEIEHLELLLERQENNERVENERYRSNIATGISRATVLWNSENAVTFFYGRKPSGTDEVFSSLEQYQQWTNRTEEERHKRELNYIIETKESINSQITERANALRDNEIEAQDLTRESVDVQTQITRKVNKISELNKQINELKSSAPEAPLATQSFETAFYTPEGGEITRFDTKTGKVYTIINGEEKLIGNWTGLYFFTPGFNGQPGIPIYERPIPTTKEDKEKREQFIKEESYLMATDVFASQRGNTTANHPSQNPAIQASDADKAHSCDLSDEIRTRILTKRKDIMMAMKWLRDKIASFFSGAANSAIGQWIKATVKQLTAMLKSIQKFLKFVNDIILETALLVAKIRRLITWILSLPAQLLALLQECLTHFFNTITDTLTQTIPSEPGGDSQELTFFQEVTDLVNTSKSTFSEAQKTIESTTLLYAEIKTVEQTFEKV